MKFLVYFIFVSVFLACGKQNKTIRPDAIYHVDATWQTQDGEHLKLEELQGKVLVITMVFTSCKTACPRLTSEMKTIAQKVGNVAPDELRYILVSIDPENDTPSVMKRYLSDHGCTGKEWMFLRGDEESTRILANVIAVKYNKISPIEFSHSNIISVYSKEGILAFQKEGLDVEMDATVEEIKKQLHL